MSEQYTQGRPPAQAQELGDQPFTFACHPGVSCYRQCCRKLDLYLYPYDIIRLKQALGLDSGAFLQRYVRVSGGSHPFFPSLMLLMEDNEEHTCPFLVETGCSVYRDRPSACRTYPLERAVEKKSGRELISHYYLTCHDYCTGHQEQGEYTVGAWERDQRLHEFNTMNDIWAEIDAFFATNPWLGEGAYGPRQQLAFMVCYNIDTFRDYCRHHRLLEQSGLSKMEKRRIQQDDAELLKFGFRWLEKVLGSR